MSAPDPLWFLYGAYSAFWLLLSGFLIHLGRRHRVLDREVRDLQARVERTASELGRGSCSAP